MASILGARLEEQKKKVKKYTLYNGQRFTRAAQHLATRMRCCQTHLDPNTPSGLSIFSLSSSTFELKTSVLLIHYVDNYTNNTAVFEKLSKCLYLSGKKYPHSHT